jgi:hypothetical protein
MAYDEVKFIADLFRIGRDLHRRGDSSDRDAFQVETAATEVERLLRENAYLRAERDRMRVACEAAREFLARQEKGRVLKLIRAALDGVDPPAEGVKTLTISPEQYELGSAVAFGFTARGGPFVRREPYRLVRRLPDGNYLVEDPAAAGPEGERRSDGDA